MWTKPEHDLEGFEEHYRTTHTDIVRRWPGFVSAQVLRTPASPTGEPRYHLVTVVEVDDLRAALTSDAGKEAVTDAMRLMETHGNRLDTLTGDRFG